MRGREGCGGTYLHSPIVHITIVSVRSLDINVVCICNNRNL